MYHGYEDRENREKSHGCVNPFRPSGREPADWFVYEPVIHFTPTGTTYQGVIPLALTNYELVPRGLART